MDEKKIERLVQITGVSYETAQNALECKNGDIVDAMVYIENISKAAEKSVAVSDPRFAPISQEEIAAAAVRNEAKSEVRKTKKSFGVFLAVILRALFFNKVTVSRNSSELITVPLIVALILGTINFRFTVVAVVIAMVLGFRFSYKKESELARL